MKEKKGVVFGGKEPVICLPVIETERDAIVRKIRELSGRGAAMVEWRMDWFGQAEEPHAVEELLAELAGTMEHTLLLCTYRTKLQGGRGILNGAAYEALNLAVAKSQAADLVDLEFYQTGEQKRQILALQEAGIWVVCSNHDFGKTPARPEMERQLLEMAGAGGDFAKLAVMPRGREDVLRLMEAVTAVKEQLPGSHLIAMSMGELGVISRLLGGWYGSEVTFASAGAASAPGQIPYEEAQELLGRLKAYC